MFALLSCFLWLSSLLFHMFVSLVCTPIASVLTPTSHCFLLYLHFPRQLLLRPAVVVVWGVRG